MTPNQQSATQIPVITKMLPYHLTSYIEHWLSHLSSENQSSEEILKVPMVQFNSYFLQKR